MPLGGTIAVSGLILPPCYVNHRFEILLMLTKLQLFHVSSQGALDVEIRTERKREDFANDQLLTDRVKFCRLSAVNASLRPDLINYSIADHLNGETGLVNRKEEEISASLQRFWVLWFNLKFTTILRWERDKYPLRQPTDEKNWNGAIFPYDILQRLCSSFSPVITCTFGNLIPAGVENRRPKQHIRLTFMRRFQIFVKNEVLENSWFFLEPMNGSPPLA